MFYLIPYVSALFHNARIISITTRLVNATQNGGPTPAPAQATSHAAPSSAARTTPSDLYGPSILLAALFLVSLTLCTWLS